MGILALPAPALTAAAAPALSVDGDGDDNEDEEEEKEEEEEEEEEAMERRSANRSGEAWTPPLKSKVERGKRPSYSSHDSGSKVSASTLFGSKDDASMTVESTVDGSTIDESIVDEAVVDESVVDEAALGLVVIAWVGHPSIFVAVDCSACRDRDTTIATADLS